MIYPIAETFVSPQGEGVYTGTQMLFVRLAGCNVGEYRENKINSICKSALGEEFICDTNYHRSHSMSDYSIKEMVVASKVKHVCITGGEPFLHDLAPLVRMREDLEVMTHIETSGTKEIPIKVSAVAWITVSPKHGYLNSSIERACELKFVVSDSLTQESESKIEAIARINPSAIVYVQPINHIDTVNKTNLSFVQSLQARHPEWRISLQLHKILGVQ